MPFPKKRRRTDLAAIVMFHMVSFASAFSISSPYYDTRQQPQTVLSAAASSTMFLEPVLQSKVALQKKPEGTVRRPIRIQYARADTKLDRGILGIQDTTTTTALQAYSRPLSTIDTKSWNLPETFSVKKSTSSSFGIPWIPELADIEQLTVLQLKNEMGARGLKKTGNKADLVKRLSEWSEHQKQRQKLEKGVGLSSLGLNKAYGKNNLEQELQSWDIQEEQLDSSNPNSLAEWARTVDLEPLMKRREAIHREKNEGKPKKATKKRILPSEYLSTIQNLFDQPTSNYSNRQVKQMYAAAKHADQVGDRELSKRILYELKVATPNDARVYQRIARLEREEGNIDKARTVLQQAVELFPDNAFPWHGLGQLEGSIGNEELQIQHWRQAIAVDPSLPHSYHALGTLLHTRGEIAAAMKILKAGIEYCPTNHRLHHALGDLYRDAKMLDMASKSYRKALKLGPPVSHGFAYTALAYVSFEQGQVDLCRKWLHRSVGYEGRNANGWVSLAQFEESLDNIDAARSACISGIAQYERGLLDRSKKRINVDKRSLLEDPVKLRNELLQTVPQYRSGDRFFNVYRNWARLEERHGTVESFEEVYERAMLAFPSQYKIALDAAEYYIKICMYDKARLRFADACRITNHAEPYRLFAQFEMSDGNFERAQRILYSGAMKQLQSHHQRGLAQLFYTWAVCEWHLGNISHAETLFEYALDEVTDGKVSRLRSVILFSMAKFEYYREEYIRAQHYVGLCLQENLLPGGNAQIWELWRDIAIAQKDEAFARQCEKESINSELETENVLSDIKISMRRDPWHQTLFAGHGGPKCLYLELPDRRRFASRGRN